MASGTKKRLVVGNWKMYVESGKAARALALGLKRRVKNFKKVEVWIAPPMPFIAELAKAFASSKIKIGAQNVSRFGGGKHTGEVSAKMLKSADASFSIVGHSERRETGESDADIAAKVLACAEEKLCAIVCVGERARDEHGGHFDFIAGQLRAALADFPRGSAAKLVVAYEPLWAIGKMAADAIAPQDLRETAIFIRKILTEKFTRAEAAKIPILYGGSVEGVNAAELIEGGGVDGFLVGRASADAEQFLQIIAACA